MFLMFYLMRPNVLPVDDLGLIRGTERMYFKGKKHLTPKAMREFGQRWQPWCTVATWYLWRALEAVPQD
jgi:DNA-3-methyladenine glycosylase II